MMDRMMGRILGVAAALFLAAAFTFAAPATAEAQASFGPQLNYGTEVEALGVGARADLGLGGQGFGVIGSFDVFFPDNYDWWEINGNARYAFGGGSSAMPYLGAGLNIASIDYDVDPEFAEFADDDTESGLNILGGAKFGGGGLTPFIEGRYSTIADGRFVITGGFLF